MLNMGSLWLFIQIFDTWNTTYAFKYLVVKGLMCFYLNIMYDNELPISNTFLLQHLPNWVTMWYCGRVFLILMLDPDNTLQEIDEFNNYVAQPLTINCDNGM